MLNRIPLILLAFGLLPAASHSAPAKKIRLALIHSPCGMIEFRVDPATLRPKDIHILRQFLSYMADGANVTFSYPGSRPRVPTARERQALIREMQLAHLRGAELEKHIRRYVADGVLPHKGPSKDAVRAAMREREFARRAGKEFLEGFNDYPTNGLAAGLIQRIEDRFRISEAYGMHTDENCHTNLAF